MDETRLRRALAAVLATGVALAIGLAAAQPPPTPAAAAPLPQTQRITITTPSTGLFEMPFIMALRRGYFAEEGLDINRVQMAPPVSIAAVLAGEAEYALATGSGSVAIASADAPLKLVMGIAVRALHVLVTNDPAVHSVPDLRGKSVATSTLTDSSAAFVRFALRAQGLQPQVDVSLQALGQSPNRLAAMQSGQVTAVILDLAHALEAQRAGARTILRPSDLPDLPTSGLVVTEVRLRDQPQQIERVIRPLLKGIHYFRDNREDSVLAMMDHLGLERDVSESTWDQGVGSFAPDGIIPDTSLRLLLEAAELASERPSRIAPEQLADFTIVRRVNAQLSR